MKDCPVFLIEAGDCLRLVNFCGGRDPGHPFLAISGTPISNFTAQSSPHQAVRDQRVQLRHSTCLERRWKWRAPVSYSVGCVRCWPRLCCVVTVIESVWISLSLSTCVQCVWFLPTWLSLIACNSPAYGAASATDPPRSRALSSRQCLVVHAFPATWWNVFPLCITCGCLLQIQAWSW